MSSQAAAPGDGHPLTDFPDGFRQLPGWTIPMLDPQLDLRPAPVSKVLLIAANPRTGSSLFCEDLRMTCRAGVPDEYLHSSNFYWAPRRRGKAEQQLDTRWRLPRSRLSWRLTSRLKSLSGGRIDLFIGRFSKRAVLAWLRQAELLRTTPNGVFSMKVHAATWTTFFLARGLQPSDLGPEVSWLRTTRADRLGQAISWVKAEQTSSWVQGMETETEPVYDEQAITDKLAEIDDYERCWDDYFTAAGLEPHVVEYEAYVADRMGGLTAALAAVGIEVPELVLGAMPRQADATNDEWRNRYLEDRPGIVS